jgi:hypothetical protein
LTVATVVTVEQPHIMDLGPKNVKPYFKLLYGSDVKSLHTYYMVWRFGLSEVVTPYVKPCVKPYVKPYSRFLLYEK